MNSSKPKYKKEKIISIEYKPSPMSPFYNLEKKLKKKDTIELAKLYNDKCFQLYQDIENLKTEIDNYKSIIADLQVELSKKETIRGSIIQKKPSKDNNEVINEIKNDYEEQIHNLEHQIETLTTQNESQAFQIRNLNDQLNQTKKEQARFSSLRKSQEHIKPKSDSELNKKLTEVLIENMFLMYLLDRSVNYEKGIRELNENFEQYFKVFIEEGKNVNNIFSSIIHEFLYRIHKRADIRGLAELIFNRNCITQSEDYEMRYTDNPFFTSNLIDDDMIIELNKKIYNYRNDSIKQISLLIQKVQDAIHNYPELDKLKQFEVNSLFTFDTNKHMRINLNKLNNENGPFLISSIKYNENDIRTIEFFGEIKYVNNKCEELTKIIYQLIHNYKNTIKSISLTQVTNIQADFLKWISYLIENAEGCTRIIMTSCKLDDEQIKAIHFKQRLYDIIDMTDNNLTKLQSFIGIQAKQLLLSKNHLNFYDGDSKINVSYLDLSGINYINEELNNFALFMQGSPIQLINFSNMKIKENNAIILNNCLKSLTNLKVIFLNSCEINEKTTKDIFKDLYEKPLLEIYINNNNFGDEGCIELWKEFVEKSKTIIKIEMKNCLIGDIGIKAVLAQLKVNNQIKELNFEENKFNKELINDMENKEKTKLII